MLKLLLLLATAYAIQCDVHQRCDSNEYCVDVCQTGTVHVDPWLQQALKIQNQQQRHKTPCAAQFLGSHNSAITLANGYGTENHQYSKLFADVDLHPSTVVLNNQNISVYDQLRVGVRLVEIDVHWILHSFRVAHCGGFAARVLDGAVEAINTVGQDFNFHLDWDLQTIGCEPSFSGLPAHDQRFFVDALREIRQWLDENPDEFIMLYLDNQPSIEEWGKLPQFISVIEDVFSDILYRPIPEAQPTIGELLEQGKQLLILSRTDYGDAMEGTMVNHRNYCGWEEPKPNALDSYCTFPGEHVLGAAGKAEFTIRPTGDGIEYGPFNGQGQYKGSVDPIDPPTLQKWANCGGMPSPDFITPELAQAFVWGPREGQYIYNVTKAALSSDDGRWFKANLRGLPKACRCGDNWEILDTCTDPCEHSAPITGYDNHQLWVALQISGNDAVQLHE